MSFRSILAALFFSVLLLLPVACKQPSDTVTVVSVIDGDTIVIEGGYHVRYIGIDSPETDEFYYSEAKQMNTDLVAGKKVRLESDVSDKDKYGRMLRYVFVEDTFVNAEMVRQGCAWASAFPPDVKYQVYLEAMEKEARQLKRGFWR
ncbi:MAG: thermonuclease family protein [Dehalococcoidia bacterium]|nr:thermonuclease family protein [Dehalococcoidia bacterium]